MLPGPCHIVEGQCMASKDSCAVWTLVRYQPGYLDPIPATTAAMLSHNSWQMLHANSPYSARCIMHYTTAKQQNKQMLGYSTKHMSISQQQEVG